MRARLVVVLVMAFAGCGGVQASSEPSLAPYTRPAPTVVKYEAEGSAKSATMTYTTPTGQSQEDITLPLTNQEGTSGFRWTGFAPGAFLYVSVQNSSAYGSVTCRIVVGDEVISENTANADYGIATCQGTAK